MSRPVTVERIAKPVCMRFTGERAVLPPDVQRQIDGFWDDLLATGGRFTRGDVFTIRAVDESSARITVDVDLTDYAHYLATSRLPEIADTHPCRVMHTAVLIHSADDRLIFGEMATHTATPQRLQCAGGGITTDDLRADQTFDVTRNAATELAEETGLHHTDPAQVTVLDFTYLKFGGPRDSVGALHVARSPLSALHIVRHFETFNDFLRHQGDEPELAQLICLPNDLETITRFLAAETRPIDDYLPELLRTHARATAL